MSKDLFIGANWKMHAVPNGACDRSSPYVSTGTPQVVVFPMYIDLQHAIRSQALIVGAQYGRAEDEGAFTGDISMKYLKELGCAYVLCGHSERRMHHAETNAMIAEQVRSALSQNMTPILCVGETEFERNSGVTNNVIADQLNVIHEQHISSDSLIIAYEPVWAIGTGKTPSPSDVNTMHAFMKDRTHRAMRVIYGGSVNGSNARSFFEQPMIDGALVGGASLNPTEFASIINAARMLS